MNNKEFEELVKKFEQEEQELLLLKGKEYTIGNEDRLYNFKSIAEKIGISPMQLWAIYFQKHSDSIINYVKNKGKVKSNETIQSRIQDAIVWCLFL